MTAQCHAGWYSPKGQMIKNVAIGLAWFTEQGAKWHEKPNLRQEVNRGQTVIQNLNQFLNSSCGTGSVAVWRGAGCREVFQEEVGRKRRNKDTAMLSPSPPPPPPPPLSIWRSQRKGMDVRFYWSLLLLNSGSFNSKSQNKEI